ncbi:MAG: NAD(P)-binding domain-containing protein [Vulcanimicrobiaceae bacterium]
MISSPRAASRQIGTRAVPVAIVGAGPYGLSLAAHLSARGIETQVFGSPMAAWSDHMPRGMHLKSEGFASSLSEPSGRFTLGAFCRERGIPYADVGTPVALETFVDYGREFARRFVPALDERRVVEIARDGEEFLVTSDDGERLRAAYVVVAAGIGYFAYLPPELRTLDDELLSHSSRYGDWSHLAGQPVAVIGGGSSAVDVALSLHGAGAAPELFARCASLRFHEPPDLDRGLLRSLIFPRSGIGNTWRAYVGAEYPDAIYALPQRLRLRIVRRTLGPAPCWFTKEPFSKSVPAHLGRRLERAVRGPDVAVLTFVDAKGRREERSFDHVVAATGYRVDLARLAFLGSLRASLATTGGSPRLSRTFESSLEGLYFVGLAAAASFGPVQRFAYGASFAVRRVAGALAALQHARR